MAWAERLDGVIVNADSMQVYSRLDILTARPSASDMARVPHRLFGHVEPSVAYSTGQWLRDVAALLASADLDGRVVLFVGGTGLYFRALLGGLSAMPEVPDAVRSYWRDRLDEQGAAALHAELRRRDPAAAAALLPNDSQRVVRALEVIDASGRSIIAWQSQSGSPLIDPCTTQRFVLDVDRAVLVHRIDARFDMMVSNGGLAEARAVMGLGLDPSLPAMKAIGLRELAAAADDPSTIAEAVLHAKIATRQYAKRQATWFRNQLGEDWTRLKGAGEHPLPSMPLRKPPDAGS